MPRLLDNLEKYSVVGPGTRCAALLGDTPVNVPSIGLPERHQFVCKSCDRYPVTAASGITTIFAPLAAASFTSAVSLRMLFVTSPNTEEHWIAATFTVAGFVDITTGEGEART